MAGVPADGSHKWQQTWPWLTQVLKEGGMAVTRMKYDKLSLIAMENNVEPGLLREQKWALKVRACHLGCLSLILSY